MDSETPGQILYRLIDERAVAAELPWEHLPEFVQGHYEAVAAAFLSAMAGTAREGHTGIWIDLADDKLGDLRALWKDNPAITTDESMVWATVYNWVREQHEAMARRAEEEEYDDAER